MFVGNQRSPLASGGIFGRLRQRLTNQGAVADNQEDECDDENVVGERGRTLLDSFRGIIDLVSESPELEPSKDESFDFVLGGFPKSGTSSISEAFSKHKDISIGANNECFVASASLSDAVVSNKLRQTAAGLTDTKGLKCPNAIFNYRTISRLENHSPSAKFIIGVRHPVKMIESFYNGLVDEIYEGMIDEEIPAFEEVMSSKIPWKDLSFDATRYELFLMQFAKTTLTPAEMGELVGHESYEIAIRPNNFGIFLYSDDQLQDEDMSRSSSFRSDLQGYLNLSDPISSFSRENVKSLVGSDDYAESISICDKKYSELRLELVSQGKKTAKWLTERFMQSHDVKVANQDHFIELVSSWGEDPCVAVST